MKRRTYVIQLTPEQQKQIDSILELELVQGSGTLLGELLSAKFFPEIGGAFRFFFFDAREMKAMYDAVTGKNKGQEGEV